MWKIWPHVGLALEAAREPELLGLGRWWNSCTLSAVSKMSLACAGGGAVGPGSEQTSAWVPG